MAPRLKVYIAGPITKGDLKHNLDQATAAFVALAKAGLAPFCPHWSAYSKPVKTDEDPETGERRVYCHATVSGNDEMSHEDWMGVDLPWVAASDAVLRLPGESSGADRETIHAGACGIPVFHSVYDVVAWAKTFRPSDIDPHPAAA